jgi:lipopolysaccharide transport protein LptA
MLSHRKVYYIIIPFLLLGFLIPGSGISQNLLKNNASADKDKPIEINSDRMRSEDGGKKIIFSGNVIGTWGDLTINSDILEIYNSESDNTETDEVVAIGNVFITRDKKRAKGDRAVYLDKLQKIILTGKPHATAWEEKNIIEGKEMIFLLEQDRFVVNKRVRMKLFPKKKQTQARTNDKKTKNSKVWVDAKK